MRYNLKKQFLYTDLGTFVTEITVLGLWLLRRIKKAFFEKEMFELRAKE